MHIDNDKLVGTYVSDRYSEKGTVTIVLTDGDSTPTREYTRYKYVQTEQLTAIGVAVKDYGAVLVPETTIELLTNGTLNPADFGVFVKFNDEYYNIGLSTLLSTEIGATVTFNAGGLDSYAPTTFNATLPPYSVGNAGQVPTVDENGKVGWDDIPEELPSVTGNTGKFLGVNDGGTGVEWKNVPNELPTIGDSDAGKVLKVNAEHTGTEWGEASSGGTKYVHNINIHITANVVHYYLNLIITNNISTPLTSTDIINYLSANISGTKYYPCGGGHTRNDQFVKGTYNYIRIESISESTMTIGALFHNNNDNTSILTTLNMTLFANDDINDFVS